MGWPRTVTPRSPLHLFDRPQSYDQRRLGLEQQEEPYVENTRFRVGRVVYAGLHVVGSNDDLGDVAPGSGRVQGAQP